MHVPKQNLLEESDDLAALMREKGNTLKRIEDAWSCLVPLHVGYEIVSSYPEAEFRRIVN